jgi:membrane associated rhomboid family serine protease
MIPLRDTQPSARLPAVTLVIIAINLLVFLYQVWLDPFSRVHFASTFGLTPERWLEAKLTLLTYMFLHGVTVSAWSGLLHVAGNCWILWIYGDNVEDVLGHWRYLLFYTACGVAAALLQVASDPYSRLPIIGASGAVAGVMGAYLVRFPHARLLMLVPVLLFITTFEAPAWLGLLYWFAVQLISGAGSAGAAVYARPGVAWFAHIGGFLAGALLIMLLRTRERLTARRDLQW